MSVPPVAPPAEPDPSLRDRLTSIQSLLALSMVMTDSGDEQRILQLATTTVPSLGHSRLLGAYLPVGGWLVSGGSLADAEVRADIEAQFVVLTSAGGSVAVLGESWAWAFPLRSLGGHFGFLLVGADAPATGSEQFLLRMLAQQTGIALANARLHARERAVSAELRASNAALADTIAALERSTEIHHRLTDVAVAGEGAEGIARVLHELTGHPVAIEDQHGSLRAWAGPGQPDGLATTSPDDLLRQVPQGPRATRVGGRLVAAARVGQDVLGLLILLDPDRTAGGQDLAALEHGATVLAKELARQLSLSESEQRLARDLVNDLLVGGDIEHAVARAQTLGYDLNRPGRIVVAESPGRTVDEDVLFSAVRQSALELTVGTLLVPRGRAVVLLADADRPWEELRVAVRRKLAGGRCRIGVGGRATRPADFPRSHREAQLALKMQQGAGGSDRVTMFDQLGVYRLLAEVPEAASIDRFVREGLGALLDYDAEKRTDLVATLTEYLGHGGNYDATAKALAVHRSTLKYRLQRIREISGHDLTDPETLFNLQLATRARQTLLALTSSDS
ncbi:MAG: hypothetical protein V7637_35 [Mycobacteriales bacterium]|jgi:sugar diacid utilization regulator